jgi:hypothetical protein
MAEHNGNYSAAFKTYLIGVRELMERCFKKTNVVDGNLPGGGEQVFCKLLKMPLAIW